MLISNDTRPEDLDTCSIKFLFLNMEAAKQRISIKTLATGNGFMLFYKRAQDLKVGIHYLEGVTAHEYLEGNNFVGLTHRN